MSIGQELKENLRNLGIQPGDIFVFDAPRISPEIWVGGFEDLLKSLQTLAGPGGTIIVPTCTHHEGYPKPVFDPDLSPSESGPFSEFFRNQQGVSRSHSPTHSVSGYGPMTNDIIKMHRFAYGRPSPWGDGSLGIHSPYDILFDRNSWWIMLDADPNDDPFVHYVQAVFSQNHRGTTKRTPFITFNPEKLFDHLENINLVKKVVLCGYMLRLFRMNDCVSAALTFLQEHLSEIEPNSETKDWLQAVTDIQRRGYLYAGVAQMGITPTVPCKRWDGKELTGVYRHLRARSVVFNHNDYKTALVVCDLLGITGDLVARIRRKAFELTTIPADKIQVVCTHSHSTPDTVGAGYEDPAYLEYLVVQVAKSIQEAERHLQPARIGTGKAMIHGIAHSRRRTLKDGKTYTTRYGVPSSWRVKPELVANEGTIDPEVSVIRIETLDGMPIAGISNFGCHASIALMSSNLSGDYLGEAMHLMEMFMGKDSVFLCTNGTAADVDPTLEVPFWGPRSDESAHHIGTLFAAQILEVLERIECVDDVQLADVQIKLDLPVRADWVELFEHNEARVQTEISKGWSLSPVVHEAIQNRELHTEVQALRLNDLVLVSFPGEIFSELGLDLKKAYPQIRIAVVELANDTIGYIPTYRAFEEGGYEVDQNLWGRVAPDSANLLMEAAHCAIQKVTAP